MPALKDAVNLYLIGYRGTGKSTVARRLGLLLARPWIDADVEIETRAGKSIARIFADRGEPAFRALESEVLADLARRCEEELIVGVGGGGVLRSANRAALARSGSVVWLQADAETIFERIGADPATAARRPNLTAAGGRGEIEQLLAERTPVYRACADLEVDTAGKTADDVAGEIAARLNLSPSRQDPAS